MKSATGDAPGFWAAADAMVSTLGAVEALGVNPAEAEAEAEGEGEGDGDGLDSAVACGLADVPGSASGW